MILYTEYTGLRQNDFNVHARKVCEPDTPLSYLATDVQRLAAPGPTEARGAGTRQGGACQGC